MNRSMAIAACLGLLAAIPSPAFAQQSNAVVSLFDGKSLNNWAVDAPYASNFSVKGGLLHIEGAGGWLRSARQYSEFTLKVELRFLGNEPPDTATGAMGGIFLRANADVDGKGWPTAAYEVQLSNRGRAGSSLPGDPRWSGALLRRGAAEGLTSLDGEAALGAYGKTGAWQTYEIQALGNSVSVFINGRFVGSAATGNPGAGNIGLQAENGAMEIRSIQLVEGGAFTALATPADGFVPLFDGKTLNGWVVEDESKNFPIVEGALRVAGREGERVCAGGLRTAREYADYTLQTQFRINAGADSGLYFRLPPTPASGPVQAPRYQIQLRENPATPSTGMVMRLAGIQEGETSHDFAAAARARGKTGEWQLLEVEAIKSNVSVRLNGILVTRVRNVPPTGYIGFECATGNVDFRAIKVKEYR